MSAKKKKAIATKSTKTAKVKATKATPPRARAAKPKGKGGAAFDPSWHGAFLEFYSRLPVIAMACRHIKIDRKTFYEHVEKDPVFAQGVADAKIEGLETVEGMGFHLATVGAARKKFDKGEPVIDPVTGEQYIEYEVDAGLIQFILKNKLPEVYGDKSKVDMTVNDLTDEEIVKRGRSANQSFLLTYLASKPGEIKA